jgi:hypothetical protein
VIVNRKSKITLTETTGSIANQTLVEWSLDGPLPKLCPISNQDGHQAKNRKKGGMKFIPARFGLIWFSGFREEDLNVIFYQNMPNLHNRYKSAERKISQKNPERSPGL